MDNLDAIHDRLITILAPYRDKLITVQDDNNQLYLDTPHKMQKDKPLGFGGIAKRSKYVSYYLMPVYLYPDLIRDISSDLEMTMRGRSSFSLTELDDDMYEELVELTERGFNRFESEGLLEPPEEDELLDDDDDDFDDLDDDEDEDEDDEEEDED